MTYTQNILWTFGNSKTDSASLLAHTWTLSIEEQFYLIWPLIVFFTPQNKLLKVALGFVIIGVLFRIVLVSFNSNTLSVIILLFSQIDLLSLGAILAIVKSRNITLLTNTKKIKTLVVIGIIGIFLIIIRFSFLFDVNLFSAYQYFRESTSYSTDIFSVNIHLFIGFVSLSLVYFAVFVNKTSLFNKILSSRFLIHIGKISYGLYLYHWPIYILLSGRLHNKFVFVVVGFVITYLVSFVSYYLFEKKINKFKDYFQ